MKNKLRRAVIRLDVEKDWDQHSQKNVVIIHPEQAELASPSPLRSTEERSMSGLRKGGLKKPSSPPCPISPTADWLGSPGGTPQSQVKDPPPGGFDSESFSNMAQGYNDNVYMQLIKGLVSNSQPGSPLKTSCASPTSPNPKDFGQKPSASSSAKPERIPLPCPGFCGYEVTGHESGYCCGRCSKNNGHGAGCEMKTTTAAPPTGLFFTRFVAALENENMGHSEVELMTEGYDNVSHVEAASNALRFVRQRTGDLNKVFARFSPDGRLASGENFPASAFNDFYKWTMLPVMRVVERVHPKGVSCTFSANIRDTTYRRTLYDSAVGRTDPDLINALKSELEKFASRRFDREIFLRLTTEYNVPGWDEATLDSVCGQFWNPRALADKIVFDLNGVDSSKGPIIPQRGEVVIHVFLAHDIKIHEDRVFVEATGPWHRVTWLETSLMQILYEVLFRDSMRKKYKCTDDTVWYPKWLAEAFVRCARSEIAARRSGLRGALFGGRRTGGLPLLMIQAMYLKQFFVDDKGNPKLIGTSSVTAHYWLRDDDIDAPRPAGTHAHELSMVLSSVLCDLDDKCGLPLSQAIGHALYFHLSVPQGDVQSPARRVLMPMLPDTLGTRAFMKTVFMLKVTRGPHKGDPFLSIIGAARQDSGDLVAFRDICKEFGFQGAMMASEIDGPPDLFHANACGYALFGAGGFFGDSKKAWDPTAKNISMAVKVLRVYVGGEKTAYSPVKTGDPCAAGEGKFEADGLLTPEEMDDHKKRTKWLQDNDVDHIADRHHMQELFRGVLDKFLGPEPGAPFLAGQ